MRPILVCSAGFGDGHHSAARGLCAALEELGAARGMQPEFVDLIAQRHPGINRMLTGGYRVVLNYAPRLWARVYRGFDQSRGMGVPEAILGTLYDAMAEIIERTAPAAVVSTYPLYSYVLDELARRGMSLPFPRITVITDSTSINAVWLRATSDHYLVPDERTAAVLRDEHNVPAAKVHALGFPVNPRFAALHTRGLRPDPADPEGGRRVLFMVNAAKGAAPELVSRLLSEDARLRLTVVAGRDTRLHGALRRAAAGFADRATVLGWTKEVPELLSSHHLVISKAGGATVQEAIAAGCPMLFSQVSPGQEEGNARLLLDADAGRLTPTPEAIVEGVREAFAGRGALVRHWAANLAPMGKPDAARDCARFVLGRIKAVA